LYPATLYPTTLYPATLYPTTLYRSEKPGVLAERGSGDTPTPLSARAAFLLW